MIMKNVKAVAGVLVIFMLGVMTGVLASGLIMEHRIESFHKKGPPPIKPLFMKKIAGSLDLSAGQKKAVEKNITVLQQRLGEIRREFHPRLRSAIDDCYREIEKNLDPRQKKKMAQLIKQMPGPFCPGKQHPLKNKRHFKRDPQ